MSLLKILIVDDARLNRKMLSVIFGSEYEALEAKDGEEALMLLEKYNEEIGLVLLDLNMPKMNGLQVLENMSFRGWKPQIPVIVVTGSGDLEDELQLYRRGADDILNKPFVPEIVLRKARNLMELYASRKRLSDELGERTAQLDISKKYDSLTGLLNMQSFLDAADEILQGLEEEEYSKYKFAYSNITNFKYYNSRFGKEQGDILIRKLAKIVRDNPANVLCARFGQDHLVVLSNDEDFEEHMRAVNEEFEQEYEKLGMKLKIGVCPVQKSGKLAYFASELAMEACNSIHGTFQNYCEYDDTLDHQLKIRQYVIQNIDAAIKNDWIQVYYQPVVRTITGAVCGMEALARWIDPRYGFLSPAAFIPALEESGQIYKVDQHVIEQVCKMLAEHEKDGVTTVPVSVNLSRVDFVKFDIVEYIEQITQKYRVTRDMINIEITESVTMSEQQLINRCVDRLHKLGYRVWMDDFGSGYSSLNILKDLRFDEIKLDRGFMRNFNENSRKLVSSIVAMAKNMGMATLAEGVETEEQLEFLRSIGCERIQGFLVSPPKPICEIHKLMEANERTMENRKERGYFDKIGILSYEANRTMAVTEYDGKQYRILYANDRFMKEWNSFSFGELHHFIHMEQERKTPFWKKMNSLLLELTHDEEFHEMEYAYQGYTLRLRSRCLSACDDRMLCELEIMNITKDENLLANILDYSGQFIQICHPEDYTMVYANQVTRMISIDPEKPYIGEKCYQYMLGLDAPCSHCPMKQMGDAKEKEIEVDDGEHCFALKAKYTEWKGRRIFIEYGRDITEIKRAQRRYDSQIKSILESIPEEQGVFHVDVTADQWISSSGNARNARELQGIQNVDMLVEMIASFVPDQEGKEQFFDTFCRDALLKAYEQGHREIQRDTRSYYDDQSIRWSRITAKLILNPESRHLESVIYGIDISKEKEQEKVVREVKEQLTKAEYEKRIDFLTGLHNRLDLLNTLRESLSGKERPIQAMYMIDIDNFKELNDIYGHLAGDECLRQIGAALKDYEKEHDIVFYRYGGEEFLGLGFDSESSAQAIADDTLRIIKELNIAFEQNTITSITASIGYTRQNSRYEKMIDLADKAMYRAKTLGKNQVVCLDEGVL